MLSCRSLCDDDSGDNWYYYYPDDFSIFKRQRRKRCCSCNRLIGDGEQCVIFNRYRPARPDIEERIRGDEISLADFFMCEKCGEIYFNLSELGYCISLGSSMQDMLSEYQEMTGFRKELNSNG